MESLFLFSVKEFFALDFISILSLGVVGFGFLMALLAFFLLRAEQKKPIEQQSTNIRKSISNYMAFTIALCLIGLASQIFDGAKSDTTASAIKFTLKYNRNDNGDPKSRSQTIDPDHIYFSFPGNSKNRRVKYCFEDDDKCEEFNMSETNGEDKNKIFSWVGERQPEFSGDIWIYTYKVDWEKWNKMINGSDK